MPILPADLPQKMLQAAGAAAGREFDAFKADMTDLTRQLAQQAELCATHLTEGSISAEEAREELEALIEASTMLADLAEVEARVAAQDAINAAMDVLWAAVKTAAKLP